MKFDPLNWQEEKPNAEIQAPKGKLRLRLSQAAPVFVSVEGFEALAGVGTTFDLEVSEAVTFRVEASKSCRVFRQVAFGTTVRVDADEVFTNADRMPFESGALAEVTRARRMLEIERREMMREMRAEHARTKAAIRRARGEDEPQAEPDQGEPLTAKQQAKRDAQPDAEAEQEGGE